MQYNYTQHHKFFFNIIYLMLITSTVVEEFVQILRLEVPDVVPWPSGEARNPKNMGLPLLWKINCLLLLPLHNITGRCLNDLLIGYFNYEKTMIKLNILLHLLKISSLKERVNKIRGFINIISRD